KLVLLRYHHAPPLCMRVRRPGDIEAVSRRCVGSQALLQQRLGSGEVSSAYSRSPEKPQGERFAPGIAHVTIEAQPLFVVGKVGSRIRFSGVWAYTPLPGFAPGAPSLESQLALQ